MTALLLLLATAQAGQAIEQIAAPVPPVVAAAPEQAEGAPSRDVAVPQLPPDARAVQQPRPQLAAPTAAPAADDALIGYSAILGPGSVPRAGVAPAELGPITVADFATVVAATTSGRPATSGEGADKTAPVVRAVKP